MKKIESIALSTIAMALIGSAAMANAADLTTNTTVAAKVVEPVGITATYTEFTALTLDQVEQGYAFGNIKIMGYNPNTTYKDVSLSDAMGIKGQLTFSDTYGDPRFLVKNYSVSINGQTIEAFNKPLPEDSVELPLQAISKQGTVEPGVYKDLVTVTLQNQ